MRPVRLVGLGLSVVRVCRLPGLPEPRKAGTGFCFARPKATCRFAAGSTTPPPAAISSPSPPASSRSIRAISARDVRHRRRRRADRANEHAVRFRFSQSTTPSEFRDYVDNNRQPIQQTTEFRRLPLTGSLKAYLSKTGRSIGHFAWIPSRYAPYVGGGGGAMWYRFRQARRLHRLRDVQGVSRHFRVRRLDADRARLRRHRRLAQSAIRRDGRRTLRVGAQAPQHRLRAVPADRSVRVLR